MKKEYYKQLAERYFDASLSPREERRLNAFLATTTDPEFDGVKAVSSYFSLGRKMKGSPAGTVSRRWVTRIAAAAVVAVVAGTLLFARVRADRHAEAMASMESTLTDIFSSGTDIETELSTLLNP